MTLNYYYSSPASCLLCKEKNFILYQVHIVSGLLQPASNILITESKLSVL